MKRLLLLLAVILALPAYAYVPKFWMIMSRTAENHGRGLYVIDQDVIFHHQAEPITLREQWLVKDGEAFRVRVTGRGHFKDKIQLTMIYDDTRKHYVDGQSRRRVAKVGDDWFEPFFYFRYSDKIKPELHKMGIIPKNAIKDRSSGPPPETGYTGEDFVQLARVGGVVTYAIGPQPKSPEDKRPRIWIDQDQFLVRKLRLPSEAEVTADKFNQYSRRFWFPQNREIVWDQNRVQINVVNFRPIKTTSKILERFKPTSLDVKKEPHLVLELPDDSVIQDFYKRFR